MNWKSILCCLLVAFFASTAGHASITTMDLDNVFSGATPSGAAPWLAAEFEDASPTTVQLTFDATNLVGNEFVSAWYLNFNPALNPAQLSFAIVPPNPTQLGTSNIQTGVNAFKADGDGFYDILFSFPPPPGSFSAEFTAGKKVVVDISRAGGLTVSDFLDGSVGGAKGSFYSAAHIQGIGSDSGWIGTTSFVSSIPEPSLYALILGTAGLGVSLIRRRRA